MEEWEGSRGGKSYFFVREEEGREGVTCIEAAIQHEVESEEVEKTYLVCQLAGYALEAHLHYLLHTFLWKGRAFIYLVFGE